MSSVRRAFIGTVCTLCVYTLHIKYCSFVAVSPLIEPPHHSDIAVYPYEKTVN